MMPMMGAMPMAAAPAQVSCFLINLSPPPPPGGTLLPPPPGGTPLYTLYYNKKHFWVWNGVSVSQKLAQRSLILWNRIGLC